jgi:hypothetical protein
MFPRSRQSIMENSCKLSWRLTYPPYPDFRITFLSRTFHKMEFIEFHGSRTEIIITHPILHFFHASHFREWPTFFRFCNSVRG